MHSFHPSDERPVPRSKLGATLLRLHRNLEGSRQREQDALDLFESWQSRWADHRDLIARRLECLDQELAQLTLPGMPTPQLSLVALSEASEDQTSEETAESQNVRVDEAEPTISGHILWHSPATASVKTPS